MAAATSVVVQYYRALAAGNPDVAQACLIPAVHPDPNLASVSGVRVLSAAPAGPGGVVDPPPARYVSVSVTVQYSATYRRAEGRSDGTVVDFLGVIPSGPGGQWRIGSIGSGP